MSTLKLTLFLGLYWFPFTYGRSDRKDLGTQDQEQKSPNNQKSTDIYF